MKDQITTVQELKDIAKIFVSERNWEQYHSLKNLSMSIATEASELMEIFMWSRNSQEIQDKFVKDKKAIEDEIADILLCILNFVNSANIDLSSAFNKKMELNRTKYHIDKAYAKCNKYTEL
jgi:dCTP diphosphatase